MEIKQNTCLSKFSAESRELSLTTRVNGNAHLSNAFRKIHQDCKNRGFDHPSTKTFGTEPSSHTLTELMIRLTLAAALGLWICGITNAQSETMKFEANRVYSPELLVQDNGVKMYFGGWLDPDQTNDAIYRADCGHPHLTCNNFHKVIDPVSNGFLHLNDPSIVLHCCWKADGSLA